MTTSTWAQFENKVQSALRRMNFRHVNGGPNFRVGGIQVDACGGWDDFLLIVECKTTQSTDRDIHAHISELRGKLPELRRGFRSMVPYKDYKRFGLALVTENISYTDGDKVLAASAPEVYLLDFQVLTYYENLAKHIGPQATLFNFLGELRVKPADIDRPRVPALKIRMGNDNGYLFWCDPHELVKVAYVARRGSGREKYYQRILAGNRLNEAKRFIEKGGFFPNNIIIAFERKPQFRDETTIDLPFWPEWMTLGQLIFPESYTSCWVIDGQHRLYALGQMQHNPKLQKVAVFAFEQLSVPRQAKYFIEINKEQKSVPEDLIWDLEREMSADSPRGRVATCVSLLNDSPALKDMIYLPLSGEKKRGQLKMSGVCNDLNDSKLLQERTTFMNLTQHNPLAHRVNNDLIPRRVADALSAFLSEAKGQAAPTLWTQFFLKPGGLYISFYVYEQIIIRCGGIPNPSQLRDLVAALILSINELAPTPDALRKLRITSYKQRRELLDDILLEMSRILGDPQFPQKKIERPAPLSEQISRFERRLAVFVLDKLEIDSITTLKQRSPEALWKRVNDHFEKEKTTNPEHQLHESFTLGDLRQLMERSDNRSLVMPQLTDSTDGFGDPEGVLSAMGTILQVRNAQAHGRRAGNLRLTAAYLDTFDRVLT